MLIKIFRSGYSVKIIMFLIISLLLWVPAFISPAEIVSESTFGIAYDFLVRQITMAPWMAAFFAFVLLIAQAIIFNAVLVQNPLFSKSVFLPALIYVILMSHNPAYLSLHPALFSNFFLILSLKNLYSTYSKTDALREAFNSSFWIAVASLFHLPAASMMLFIWFAFIIFRISAWREWLISIIGFITPYLFLIIIFYLFDGIPFFLDFFPGGLEWIWIQPSVEMADYIFWPVFLLVCLWAYLRFTIESADRIISVRRSFAIVNVLLLLSFSSMLISAHHPHQHAFIIFPAASVVIAYYFIETRKRIIAELFFIGLLMAIFITRFL